MGMRRAGRQRLGFFDSPEVGYESIVSVQPGKTVADKFCRVPAAQAVMHPLALASVFDQLGLLEDRQVPGNPRLAHAEGRGQLADAQLAALQQLDDAQPGGVAQRLEQFDGLFHNINISRFIDVL